MPGPKLVDCGVPEGSDLRSHFVHALEHMKHAESHAKAQLDNDVADLVNRAICNIEGETKSLLAYAVTSFLDPLMSVLGNPTQQTKVHDTRILLEQASQISRVASGGSAASEHLGCAALDLAAHDKTPNIHPVAMSSAGGAVSAVVAGWTMSGSIKQPLLRNVKVNRGNNFFNVPIDDDHAAAKTASSTKPPLLASSRFNGTFQDTGRGSSSSSRSSVTAVYSLDEEEEDDDCGFSQKSSKASTAIFVEEREGGPQTTTSVAVKKHAGEQEGRRSRTTTSDVQSSFSNTSPCTGEHHVDLVCAILSPDPRDRVSDSDEGGSPLLGDGLGGRETVNLDMELGSGCAAAAIDGLEGPADSDSGSHPLGCMDPPDR
eukprot:g8777.t1